ncbi:AGAP008958-PA-like protein [Anopheles sinensis]|uniref:AGAP008958-PA-like protein n=1 Tax=Anopheles sinensis TaxID=74873 RepID=A0A084WQH4_ANOSI|nr:AGAP008958-PA-like protein [Anopheles sinensis]
MWSVSYAQLLIIVTILIEALVCYKANYERVEQVFGQEYAEIDLRVRKYNRTTTVMNGTMYIRQPLDDNMVFSSDVFHSRLGNQQFQHYPMRLPTSGYCQFIENLHKEYKAVVEDMVNIPNPGECPVTERAIYIHDKVFPPGVLPESLAPGLWKIVITGALVTKPENILFRMMVSVRLLDDLFI